jgi:hypothetical protein
MRPLNQISKQSEFIKSRKHYREHLGAGFLLGQLLLIIILELVFSQTAWAADFDPERFARGMADPAKKMFNDYYPVAILVAGGVGAFLSNQGDLRDKMVSFGKGAAIGGVVIAAVKAGFGI